MYTTRIRPEFSDPYAAQTAEAASPSDLWPDPALSARVPGVQYRHVAGELFGQDGPKLSDVRQGPLGDSYLLAAIGSLVAKDPALVREMVRDQGNGLYFVRFFQPNDDGGYDAVWVRVDADLPTDADGRPAYASGVDSDHDGQVELWVPLLEKAYAAFRDEFSYSRGDGYADVDRGGSAGFVLEAFLGRRPQSFTDCYSDRHFRDVVASVNDGNLVVVATSAEVDEGWEGAHAYTVVRVYEDEHGVPMAVLYDPRGAREPVGSVPGEHPEDGLFAVPLKELRWNTANVHVARSTDAPPCEVPPGITALIGSRDAIVPLASNR